jgi:hypothetical protein
MFRGPGQFCFSGCPIEAEPFAQTGGSLAVTEEAEGADVVEIALTAAFCYREYVVGIPEAAAAGDGFEAIETESCGAGGTPGTFECGIGGDGVDVADGTVAAVASKDLVAKVAGVGAEAPLVDAVVGTEGTAAFSEDFKVAPTAQWEAVGAFWQGETGSVAAGERTGNKHR